MADEPTPWRMILDQLTRIENTMLTRAEFSAHQQRFDGAIADMHKRIDDVQARAANQTAEWRAESMAAHKDFDRELDAIKAGLDEERKEKQKEASSRRLACTLSIVGGVISVITGVTVFIVQGVIGG